MVQAKCKGRVVADSDATIVIDGVHYFPRSDVDASLLQDSDTKTLSRSKGTARYHHVVVDGVVHENNAWYYSAPMPANEQLRDHVAFCKDVEVG